MKYKGDSIVLDLFFKKDVLIGKLFLCYLVGRELEIFILKAEFDVSTC